MKTILFSLATGALVLTGCSSAFRTAETPDDVYYSYGPARQAAEDDRYTRRDDEVYESYWDDSDDRYLRMKVRDRERWGRIDDLAYWNGGFAMNPGFGVGFNPWNNWNTWNSWNSPWGWNSWNSPWAWNSWSLGFGVWNHPFAFTNMVNNWNNPWCWNRPVVVVNKYPTRQPTAYSPRPSYNRGGFNNSLFDRGNGGASRNSAKPSYQQPGYGNSSLFRTIFSSGNSSGGSSNGNNSSWSRPARFFEPSSSSGSSSGSSRTSGSSSGSSSSSSSSSGGGGRGGRGGN